MNLMQTDSSSRERKKRCEHGESLVTFSSTWVITQDWKKQSAAVTVHREDSAEVGKKQL